MKRKTPMARSASLRRGNAMARKPMKGRGKTRKAGSEARWRSAAYLEWVRAHPCCVCGTTRGVIAHHLIGMWHVGGMGLKAADSYAMPTCDGPGGCHAKIHAQKSLRDKQPEWLNNIIRQALDDVLSAEIREELTHALAFIEEMT